VLTVCPQLIQQSAEKVFLSNNYEINFNKLLVYSLEYRLLVYSYQNLYSSDLLFDFLLVYKHLVLNLFGFQLNLWNNCFKR
jgi:hypothetical protein